MWWRQQLTKSNYKSSKQSKVLSSSSYFLINNFMLWTKKWKMKFHLDWNQSRIWGSGWSNDSNCWDRISSRTTLPKWTEKGDWCTNCSKVLDLSLKSLSRSRTNTLQASRKSRRSLMSQSSRPFPEWQQFKRTLRWDKLWLTRQSMKLSWKLTRCKKRLWGTVNWQMTRLPKKLNALRRSCRRWTHLWNPVWQNWKKKY